MAKTYEELLAGATQIKNNELPESNTHSLVGGQLVDMVEKQKEDSERIDNVSKSHKGYFQTLEQLKAKYPTPKEGETAWVGEPYPGNVFDVVDGAWHDTGVPANEGGGSGTSNYNDLDNKPSIGNVSLEGDKTLDELGIASKQEVEKKQDAISQVNVTVDNAEGTPSGSASVDGSTLNINFQNIKGKQGETGPANIITIGTVTPSDSTDEASATMRGEAPNQILDLTLPRGRQGNSGVTGKPEDLVVVNDLNGGESEVGSIKVLAAEQGKVLFEKKYTELALKTGFYLNDSGEEEASVNWDVTEFVKIQKGDSIIIDGFPSAYGTIFLYDLRKNFLKAYKDESATQNSRYIYNFSNILTDDVCYMRTSVRNANIESVAGRILISSNVIQRNSIYDDIEHVFTNNAFDGKVQYGYLNTAGTEVIDTENKNWITTDYLAVYLGELVKYRGVPCLNTLGALYATYDENKEVISVVTSPVGMTLSSASLPINSKRIKYIRFSTKNYDVKELFIVSSSNYDSVESNNKKNVNYVGMSIWYYDGSIYPGTEEIQVGYQHYLNKYFNKNTGTNYCYSGNSLGGNSAEDSSSIMNKSSTWVSSENAVWTLDTITNDFKRNIPIGTIDDYNQKNGITTYYGALREFKDKVTELSGSDAIVIVSNALRRNNDGYTSTSENTVGATLVDYEKALLEVAKLNNWYFVDQYRLSGINEDTLMLTTHDGLHLNNMGYKLAVLPWISVIEFVTLVKI